MARIARTWSRHCRLISALMMIALSTLLAACSDDDNPPPPVPTATVAVQPSRTATPKPPTPTVPRSPSPQLTDFRRFPGAELVTTKDPKSPVFFFLVSGLSRIGQSPFVLTVPNNSYAPGTAVTLESVHNAVVVPTPTPTAVVLNSGQLWYLHPDGTLRSALGNGLLLGYNISTGSAVTQVVDPRGGAIQKWRPEFFNYAECAPPSDTPCDGYVHISNQFNPGNLYGVDQGEAVQFGTAFAAPANQWTPWPSYPLRGILAQQPEGFTQFQGDEAKAYDCINDYLNLFETCELGSGQVNAGLRCEYSNLAAPLSTYNIPPTPPQGCSAAQQFYTKVRDQLTAEVSQAIAVQNLYMEYAQFVNSVFIDNSAQLGPLI